ncbi:MAG TPA: sensor domain-containing diguanylate cyclase, partial [Sediminispirochaeta sp.]|nr:sensor domain-containing diguanylate cyclase [Sediminispirochaeta sp.]
IIYICMGQMGVIQAALFSRNNLEIPGLKLVRNLEGFSLDKKTHYVLNIDSELIDFFLENQMCFSLDELRDRFSGEENFKIIESLQPSLLVPLIAKSQIMGLLVLGERIQQENYSLEEKRYLTDIAHFAANAIHNAVLFEMSTTDLMTHLKQRHYFFEILDKRIVQAVTKGTKISLIMLDIDHFKQINDSYGHQVGDEILKSISATIRSGLRQEDIGARYGGEEFVILLHESDEQQAYEVAERLRQTIEKQKHPQARSVSVSMGIAQYDPELDSGPDDFIGRADNALYFSKEHGRNRSCRASRVQGDTGRGA